jgi:hypothetical protein
VRGGRDQAKEAEQERVPGSWKDRERSGGHEVVAGLTDWNEEKLTRSDGVRRRLA